jgi:hypothetical protein
VGEKLSQEIEAPMTERELFELLGFTAHEIAILESSRETSPREKMN